MRKRKLQNLFKSVRSFRHVYIPPCNRSEGQGLVLVSTEGLSPPTPDISSEYCWLFDVNMQEVPQETYLEGVNPLTVEGGIVSTTTSQTSNVDEEGGGDRAKLRVFRSSLRSWKVVALGEETVSSEQDEQQQQQSYSIIMPK